MSFESPVGAAADAKELEYIAALIQTTDGDKEGFLDASIDDRDIKYHLKSRYGINISKEQVRKIILSGFGGGEDEDDCLDICEIVAALMIPFLRKIVFDGALSNDESLVYEDESLVYDGGDDEDGDKEDGEEEVNQFSQQISPKTLLRTVLKNILLQATGSAKPQPLTKKLVHSIFASFDETALVANDELVSEMIASSRTINNTTYSDDDEVLLDVETFARVLTSDVMLYDPAVENRCTTHFVDAFGSKFEVQHTRTDEKSNTYQSVVPFEDEFEDSTDDGGVKRRRHADKSTDKTETYDEDESDSDSEEENNKNSDEFKTNPDDKYAETTDQLVKSSRKICSCLTKDVTHGLGERAIADTDYGTVTRIFTFSTLDLTVDNYRSRYHVICNWFGFILFYLRYMSGFLHSDGNGKIQVCTGGGFGCKVGQSVFNWTIIMLELIVLGLIYFMLVGSGNDVYRKSLLDVLIGISGLVIFLVLPYVFQFNAMIFRTDVDELALPFLRYIVISAFILIGSLTFIIQLLNGIRLLFSDEVIGSSKILSRLMAGTNAKDEQSFKRAASYKVNRMLHNAYKLHQQDETKKSKLNLDLDHKGTTDLALLNFTKISDKSEPVGGFLWAWKSFWNGELKSKEGIWLHTRLYAGLYAQLFLIIIIVVIASYLISDIDFIFGVLKEEAKMEGNTCSAAFDPENCYAVQDNGFDVGIIGCTGVTLRGEACYRTLITDDDDQNADGEANPLLQTTCDYIPPLPDTNTTVCDVNLVFAFEDEYATAAGQDVFTGESIQEYDCSALLTTCVVYEGIDEIAAGNFDSTQKAVCLLGMTSYYAPYRFKGSDCGNIFPIGVVLGSKPKFLQEFEDMADKAEEAGETLASFLPKRWMFLLCAAVGLSVGFLSGLSIVLNYIPSTVSTILKFRSGVIPSLRDPKFPDYRKSLEGVTYILGLMIWGVFFSAITAVLIFSGITFFAVWQVTRPIVINIIAIVIGIAATLTVKTILVTILGKVNYAAYYRKRPWVGNVCGVALECWHLGITTGYMLARTVKLLVAASMYIGRIDKPFMADDVGIIGPVHLDKFPLIYRQDLLSADAHRHPYIERLGFLYLMKIRHGSNFVTTAGSTWRLLFVFSLMPWLRKYRIADDAELPEGVLMQKLNTGRHDQDSEAIARLQEENRVLKQELAYWINREKDGKVQ